MGQTPAELDPGLTAAVRAAAAERLRDTVVARFRDAPEELRRAIEGAPRDAGRRAPPARRPLRRSRRAVAPVTGAPPGSASSSCSTLSATSRASRSGTPPPSSASTRRGSTASSVGSRRPAVCARTAGRSSRRRLTPERRATRQRRPRASGTVRSPSPRTSVPPGPCYEVPLPADAELERPRGRGDPFGSHHRDRCRPSVTPRTSSRGCQ